MDEALAVLREDLSDAHAHSKVVSYLEGHGRFREAFAQAEQGSKVFPDDWRLQDDLLRCYERDGWTAEALAMRRQQFERSPGVERYQLVLKAGQVAGQDVVVHISANVTGDFGNVTDFDQVLGCAGEIVGMGSICVG